MSGIFVGVDGSRHSGAALDWALREAGIRHEPLTVIAVQVVPTSGWGGSVRYPEDQASRADAQKAVQETVGKAAAQLGDAAPRSITVQAILGQPAEQPHRNSEGCRPARGRFPGHRWLHPAAPGLGQYPGVPARPLPRRHRSERPPRLTVAWGSRRAGPRHRGPARYDFDAPVLETSGRAAGERR